MPRIAKKPRLDADIKPFVARRGRPTQEQVHAIERVILEVARSMFLEQGYAATSMEAVATSAGISKGTLYARYASKPALFEDIVEDRLTAWRELADQSSHLAETNTSDYLYKTGLIFLQSMRIPEISAFDRLIQAEAWRFPELGHRFYVEGFARAVDELAAVIDAHGRSTGNLIEDANSVALTFYSALLGWFRNESVRHEVQAGECQRMVKRLVQIITGGRPSW